MDALEMYKSVITSLRDRDVKVFSDKVLHNDKDSSLSERSMKTCRMKLMKLGYLKHCNVGKEWNSLVNTRLIPKDYTMKDLNKEYKSIQNK